jgi:hypothetical protein
VKDDRSHFPVPERRRRAARDIVAALSLPELRSTPSEPTRPLPMFELGRLSSDTSMLYAVGHVDASGRIASSEIVEALAWRPGEQLKIVTTLGAIAIFASPEGLYSAPRKPCVVVPIALRRRYGIKPGDHVFLAAAPEHAIVLVYSRQTMNDILAQYHSARTAGGEADS